MFIVDLFYAVLLFAIGFFMIRYRKTVKSWSGNFVWAEQYIGRWWTYFILILLWMFLMFLWVLWPFWWLELLSGSSKEEVFQGQ